LWLLNTRMAGDEARKVAVAVADLQNTKNALLATRDDADATRKLLSVEIDTLKAKLIATTSEKNELAAKLAVANSDLATALSKLARAELAATATQEELAKKSKGLTDAAAKLALNLTTLADLNQLLRTREAAEAALAAKMKTAEAKLADVDAKLLALTQENANATANLATMKKTGDALTQAQATIRDLSKKVDDSNATIIDLQGDKAKLADKVDKLRIDNDSRFAGIALTGRRVVFLVDTSGSMKLVDDKTPAAAKWPTVVDTVTRVMRSLPELDQYQVVTFNRTAKYLFDDSTWQRYDGERSQKRVKDALAAVNPQGDTNLHAGFDLAFALKPDGLDTIYLFSDGLPTSGPGLTPEQDKKLTDSERTDYHAKLMRQQLQRTWNPPDRRRVRVNSIGFFFESPEVGAFLWALSRENDGSFVGMSKP
jgi:hypothetical protein